MLTRAQQILIKRAQREAGLDDGEYRDILQVIARANSSTDPHLTNRHCDKLLAFFEAIYWRRVDAGQLPDACKASAIFLQRRHWAEKNNRGQTSRDRYIPPSLGGRIAELETALAELGFGSTYCAAIREKVTQGRNDSRSLYCYATALQRTFDAKKRQAVECPF